MRQQTFGTETYKITRNTDGSRRAEADASFGGTKLRATTTVGADAAPASFELEVGGAKGLTQQFTPASGGERAGEVSEEFLRGIQEWASAALAKK